MTPRLASWDAASHPDQVLLGDYLRHAHGLLARPLEALQGPLSLRLDVGLPDSVDLLAEHDLDNYAYPLASSLTKVTGRSFASVWCTKAHTERSWVTVDTATPVPVDPPGEVAVTVPTDVSASGTAYKEQIHDQLAGLDPLPPGPVELHIAFVVGPRRNWMNLWKPSIDAMGHLLGESPAGRPWHPADGRITTLGLHQTVDSALGNAIKLRVIATPAREQP